MQPRVSLRAPGLSTRDKSNSSLSRQSSPRSRRRSCRGTSRCARTAWRNIRKKIKEGAPVERRKMMVAKYTGLPPYFMPAVRGRGGSILPAIWGRKSMHVLYQRSSCIHMLGMIKECKGLSSSPNTDICYSLPVMMGLSKYGMFWLTDAVWEHIWDTLRLWETFVLAMMVVDFWVQASTKLFNYGTPRQEKSLRVLLTEKRHFVLNSILQMTDKTFSSQDAQTRKFCNTILIPLKSLSNMRSISVQ